MRVVILVVLIACSSLCGSADEPVSPPPLSPEQIVRVRKMVHSIQAEATLLQARLDQRQRELAEVYTAYELDEPRADKLQAEIVELQRLLLANHHRMQVELREIVSAERFEFLRRRLAYVVASAAAKDESTARPSISRPSTERNAP
jgi:hypothetical protein